MNLRDLVAILGHELRTPLASILGYQELLAEGLYGELNPQQREPIERIQRSAEQILSLIDGLQELAGAGNPADDERSDTNTQALLDALAQRVRPVADARGVRLELAPVRARALDQFLQSRFLRAAEFALVAAIKNSHGKTLRLDCCHRDHSAICSAAGCELDPERDHPRHFSLEKQHSPPPTAAQLRLAMAAATLASAGGTLRLLREAEGTTLELALPLGLPGD
jgi:hypothetical protein